MRVNKPFSPKEKEAIELYFEATKTLPRIPLHVVGFLHNEVELPKDDLAKIYKAQTDKTVNTMVGLRKLIAQDQGSVGHQNLKDVYYNWEKTPLPEVLALKSGFYWIIEGHHRFALQMIAQRQSVLANVKYSQSLLK